MQNELFCDSKMDQGEGFFRVSSFQLTHRSPSPRQHMPPKRGPCMSDAANLDKLGREPGTGLTPDKKEARVDRGSGSDASAALAALGGGPALQSSSITG